MAVTRGRTKRHLDERVVWLTVRPAQQRRPSAEVADVFDIAPPIPAHYLI
jgi:hypothetical protein